MGHRMLGKSMFISLFMRLLVWACWHPKCTSNVRESDRIGILQLVD